VSAAVAPPPGGRPREALNRRVLLVGLILVGTLIFFLGSGLRHDPREVISPLIGKPAPPFALADLDGRELRLEQLRGQPVVLNFWATWCVPCAAENPIFAAMARRYAGRVRFVGVVYQDSTDAIRAYERQRGSWGPTLVDPGSQSAIRYGVYGVPETFLIDSRGVIYEKVTGAVTYDGLARSLDAMLGAGGLEKKL
jgi:cytochrome c biogenesis protein CcmG/thiol:disulfide interchange protein DsbE